MSNNRTEQQALISGLAPTVDLSELQDAIITDGYVFKKDVASSASVGASTTVDYAAIDQKVLYITTDCAVSFTGLEDGQTARLSVLKSPANLVTFVGVAGYSLGKQQGETVLGFEITKVNGFVYVNQLSGNSSGSFVSGDIVFPSGTSGLSSFLGIYSITKDTAKVELLIAYTQGTVLSSLTFTIDVANVLGRFKTTGGVVCNVKLTDDGNNIPCDAVVTDNGSTYDILIDRADTPSFGTGAFVVFISFSVIIK